LETRIAILKKKALVNEVNASDEVFHYIASQRFTNIRELEGALIRVAAFAALTESEVTLELVERVLARTTNGGQDAGSSIDLDAIVRGVCKHFPYGLDDLRSKGRGKEVACARHVAIFLMKKLTSKSLRDIGKFLGGRDHSTVAHALDKVTMQLDEELDFRRQVESIEKEIVRERR